MGGGVMRIASKVANVGAVVSGGLYEISVPVEQQVFSASRKSYTLISSAELLGDGSLMAESLQRLPWELEEWEFAVVEEDSSVGELLPRVVLRGAPTKEEAEVAPLELKDAIKEFLWKRISCADGSEFNEPRFEYISETWKRTPAWSAKPLLNISGMAFRLSPLVRVSPARL